WCYGAALLALRCVAIGRKNYNYLFAGSDTGGRRAAAIYSLIESAKLNGLNPPHYLADVVPPLAQQPAPRLGAPLPSDWQPPDAPAAAASASPPHRALTPSTE